MPTPMPIAIPNTFEFCGINTTPTVGIDIDKEARL
jgi:hypothetical protein